MTKKRILFLISFIVLLGAVSWLPISSSAEEIEYTLATDDDFAGSKDGEFVYIGNDEYVEIPHIIKGVPVTSYSGMFSGSNDANTGQLKGVKSTNKNITDLSGMFSRASNLTELDLSSFDTSNVTDMSSMFAYASGLTELDLSSFDTSNVTDMNSMFYDASGLTELDLSSFDTSNVTDMYAMFSGVSSLTELDLSSFDTSNVTNMSGMFSRASSLTELDLSSFDTSNVTDMYVMFNGVSSLEKLDLSSFDTSNVTDMYGMFAYASSLTELDLSSFDTSNVTDMSYMFTGASSLEKLDLSNFDTSNVVDMSGMFAYASSLTEVDLSSFDTSNVMYMEGMFYGTSSLTKLDLREFELSQIHPTWLSYMFIDSDIKLIYAKSILDAERLKHPNTFGGEFPSEYVKVIPIHYPEVAIDESTEDYVKTLEIKPHITQFVLKGKESNYDDDDGEFLSSFAKGDVYEKSNDADITSYQYVVTENPTPDSSGWKNVDNSGTITVEGITGDYYLHVRVENEQGETASATSGVLKLDNTPPSIKLTPDTTDIVEKVNINIHAEDEHSGIEKVILPDGTETNESEFTLPVTENGTYTFEAIDRVGNSTTESITVSNIGLPATPLEPAMTSVSVEKQWKGKQQDKVVINLFADDNVIDTIELSNANGWRHTFTDLPTKSDIKDSEEIEYTVSEVPIEGYEISIVEKSKNNYVIINTEVVEGTPEQPDEPECCNNEKDEEVEDENKEVEQKEETKENEKEKNEEKDRKKDEVESTEKHNNTKDETLVERNIKTTSENVDDGESMSSDILPNTATNFYKFIVLGGLLTFIGIISFAIRNKAKSFSEK